MGTPKEGSNKGNAGKGRPKGALNKTTKAAKDAIALAAEGLGGADRLIEWAKEDPLNERAFWISIYPKLIPVTLAGDQDNPLRTIGRIELVAVSANPAS
jgi:hypothetical protein